MTSTSIYTPITPTYLYIKQHSITKKKYYGKTTRDPYTYNGSGKVWTRHINKHGKEHIVTLWVSELYYDTSIVEVALKFSVDNDIVKSKEWANMKLENGLDGCLPGVKHTEKAKANMRKPRSEEAKVNMRKSEEHKANQSVRQTGRKLGPYKKSDKPRKPRSDKGKPKSEETKANMKGRVAPNKGKSTSEETKAKQSASKTGKKRGQYKKSGKPSKPSKPSKPYKNKGKPQPQVICPHCGKTGGGSNMKRYHFDKCKKPSGLGWV